MTRWLLCVADGDHAVTHRRLEMTARRDVTLRSWRHSVRNTFTRTCRSSMHYSWRQTWRRRVQTLGRRGVTGLTSSAGLVASTGQTRQLEDQLEF